MTPTPRLRFVERKVVMHPFYKTIDAQGNFVQATHIHQVLQQWWTVDGTLQRSQEHTGEWRDVSLEKEQ